MHRTREFWQERLDRVKKKKGRLLSQILSYRKKRESWAMSPEYRERFPQFSYTGLTRKLVAMAKAYRKASARSKYIEDQIRKSALRDHTIRSLHET